ncbi:MAG: hypothetical protein ABL982_00050 [Vicinamibacterales bacterium]
MAGGPFGASFAPTTDNADRARRGEVPGAPSSEPLQVLNFKLKPQVAGAPGGVSPLQTQATSGGFSSAVVQSVLRTVFGAENAGRFSAPGLTPGDDGGNELGALAGRGNPLRMGPTRDAGFAASALPSATQSPNIRLGLGFGGGGGVDNPPPVNEAPIGQAPAQAPSPFSGTRPTYDEGPSMGAPITAAYKDGYGDY